MAIQKTIKYVCDRCGNSIEKDIDSDPLASTFKFPNNWQSMQLSQTGASLHLCDKCNAELVSWLSVEGATDMDKACINEREVL